MVGEDTDLEDVESRCSPTGVGSELITVRSSDPDGEEAPEAAVVEEAPGAANDLRPEEGLARL